MFTDYPDVMTIKDVQSALQIGRNAVYKLIETGVLHAFRIDGKAFRVLKNDLILYIEQQAKTGTV